MIIDSINNSSVYTGLNDKFKLAFDFILNNDLKVMELGTYKIDGDNVFGMLQEYDTKDVEVCRLEGHYKYIDLQYMVTGSEYMGFRALTDECPVETDLDGDFSFYSEKGDLFLVSEGMFTFFYPHDLHMPCVKVEKSSKIRKLVIKISVDN